MAERSFVEEVKKLRLGAGEVFRGEGILAVTKALLESGVSYVAGYQGAPISHLMDVLADAEDILVEHGIRFENSASEATAAATLAASVNYPLRGAVTFKGPVGVNVASDALANLASGGVNGGALVIVGEDYGEGSSIMQERTHAFAMKSQIWLLDPRPNLPSMVAAVKNGFALSEASHTPVMLMLRIRACHVHGRFVAEDNRTAGFQPQDALAEPRRDTARIALPPATYVHEQEKVNQRWPAAVRFIEQHCLNEFFAGEADDIGIVVQGGSYNTLLRVLSNLGVADVYGNTLSWSTAGRNGFRGSRKNTPYAAQVCAENASTEAYDMGRRKVDVFIKGPGSGREAAIRTLQQSGLEVLTITDTTPLPHNGCRPPKRRRV